MQFVAVLVLVESKRHPTYRANRMNLEQVALCRDASEFLRRRAKSQVGLSLARDLEALLAGTTPAGWFVEWHASDAEPPPLGQQLLVAGTLSRPSMPAVQVAGHGQAETHPSDVSRAVRWRCWPFGLDVAAWAQLPTDDPAPEPGRLQMDKVTQFEVALLRAASARIWMLELSDPNRHLNRGQLEAVQLDRHGLSDRINAWLPKADRIEWIGPWIDLNDERPRTGDLILVSGHIFAQSRLTTGVGRWGMTEINDPSLGRLGSTRDWFTEPSNLQVKFWKRYPKAPSALLASLLN